MSLSKLSKTFIVIPLLLVSSILLGLLSYNFFTQTANEIQELAVDSLQTNAEIEVSSISNILTNYIHYVKYNLDRISTSPSSIEENITGIQTSLDLAQVSTSNITDGYYFLNRNGTVVAYSNPDKGAFPNFRGFDLSHRDYFQIPKQNGSFFVSTIIDSTDHIPRIYISTPIFEIDQSERQNIIEAGGLTGISGSSLNISSSTFKGVIVSAISAHRLGNFLEDQVHPKFNGDISFLDRNGTIIHTANKTYIGKNYFGNDFQKYLKSVLGNEKKGFNDIIDRAFLSQNGVEQFDFKNSSTTIAYQSVWGPRISYNDYNYRVGTLFITVPNTLAEDVASLVKNQTTTNFTIVGVIVVISMVAAIILLRWNKFLNDAVKQKTSQLSETVEKLRKANEELKSHDIMQKEFINVAAHELRTPTQGISGNLELLEMSYIPSLFQDPSRGLDNIKQELQRILVDNDDLKNFVSGLVSIRRNAERLDKLVNDILDTSRIESNRLVLQKESFNLNEKIQNVIKDIHFRNNLNSSYNKSSKTVNILFESKEDPINVFADKIRIFEVISNLINNAIKFSDGKNILVSSKITRMDEIGIDRDRNHNKKGSLSDLENNEKDKLMAVVSIRDKGKGIDPDILYRLFTKFATKSSQGTGLGLYISKSIVESHGGKIWAQNNSDDDDNDNKGATFSFCLPLY